MAIKLDVFKVYDRLETNFLEAMMRKLGFDEVWMISRIMMCITKVTYATLINGQPSAVIKPSRGIRQGDPILPYLYLSCVEGLSLL